MGQLSDLQQARRRLGLALDPLCHDRWVIGFLRGGFLQPIAASEVSHRLSQTRPLTPLARRALYEKRPMAVTSVIETPETSSRYNWEFDWPAILYAPISEIGQRPIGLLILGSRRDHWYTEEDVAYAHGLGLTLAPMVAALRTPLGKLTPSESEVAQLLSYGLSTAEVAHAMHVDESRVRKASDDVARKLHAIGPGALSFPLIPMKRRALRL